LAHPLRVSLLRLLREHGPATATGLAERLGESSGATSYHLRQLAHYGFIVEAEGMGTRRQRWWQAAHEMTSFDLSGDAGDEEQVLGLEYLRSVASYNCTAIVDWLDGLAKQPAEWREASTISDWLLRLTPTQARDLMTELAETIERYRNEVSDTVGDEQSAVIVQFQVLPRPGPEGGA
jgi:predicted transcriptional regulator